jgi:predicted metal-dependent phosphoesterase TrpH
VIDLHLHTTASDGRLAPSALVALAAQSGVRVLSVTDHDTVAGLAEARRAADAAGLRLVDGIEITAVERGRDVHVLGYFFDPSHSGLTLFLSSQRSARVARVREIGDRLRGLGCAVDTQSLIERASADGRSIGRPAIADALVAAGHAADRQDAFERWLAAGRPAFVARTGPSLADAVATIAAAGGIASLAHPGLLGMDDEIAAFAGAGLAAIEARHRDHDAAAEARYRAMASVLGLAVSGGSDFHGELERVPPGGRARPGSPALPDDDFLALEARARRVPHPATPPPAGAR